VTRVTIAEYGAKRAKIRVFTEGELARVQWRIRGRLKTESFPNTPAGRATAKAYAKGVADARIRPNAKERIAVRELWRRFAEAEFLHLRRDLVDQPAQGIPVAGVRRLLSQIVDLE
jgi:hypothetical protein